MAYYDSTRARISIWWSVIDADLQLILVYALIAAAAAFVPPVAFVFGLGLALFTPGYAFVAALFPGKGTIGVLERAALSGSVSLMTAALTGTALYFSPFGFTPGLLSVCLAAITGAGVIIAVKRRPSRVREGQPGTGIPELINKLMASDRLNLALFLMLTLCILASVSFLSYAVLVPKQGDAFTEFYVLGPDGKAGNYPARLHPGDMAPVIVGIANLEHRDMAYGLVVLLNDSGNVSRLYEENVSVAKDQTWEKRIELKPDRTGTGLKIELLLYADGNYTAPYRDLRLTVNVMRSLY